MSKKFEKNKFVLHHLSQEKRSALSAITKLFDSVAYPGDDNLITCVYGCHDDLKNALMGIDWRAYVTKPFEIFGYFEKQPRVRFSRDGILHLTPAAFHYFVPLFIAAILLDPTESDVMVDTTCCMLMGSSFLELANAQQKLAVANAVQIASTAPGFSFKEIEKLIKMLSTR